MKKLSLLLVLLLLVCISCKEAPDNITNNITNNYTLEDQQFWERTNGPYFSAFFDMKSIGTDIYAFGNGYFFYNQDSGKSWKYVEYPDPIKYSVPIKSIYSVIITKNKEIYALAYIYSIDRQILYYTNDNGQSWTTNAINHQPYLGGFVGEGQNGSIFAGIQSIGTEVLLKITDKGERWSRMSVKSPGVVTSINSYGSNTYIIQLMPKNYSNFHSLSVSNDDGSTWTEVYSTKMELSSTAIFRIDRDGNYFIFDGCVYRSTDSGKEWEKKINGLYRSNTIDVAISPKNSIYLLSSEGIFKSNDKGESWKLFIKSTEIQKIVIDDSGHLYAMTYYYAIYRTKMAVE